MNRRNLKELNLFNVCYICCNSDFPVTWRCWFKRARTALKFTSYTAATVAVVRVLPSVNGRGSYWPINVEPATFLRQRLEATPPKSMTSTNACASWRLRWTSQAVGMCRVILMWYCSDCLREKLNDDDDDDDDSKPNKEGCPFFSFSFLLFQFHIFHVPS